MRPSFDIDTSWTGQFAEEGTWPPATLMWFPFWNMSLLLCNDLLRALWGGIPALCAVVDDQTICYFLSSFKSHKVDKSLKLWACDVEFHVLFGPFTETGKWPTLTLSNKGVLLAQLVGGVYHEVFCNTHESRAGKRTCIGEVERQPKKVQQKLQEIPAFLQRWCGQDVETHLPESLKLVWKKGVGSVGTLGINGFLNKVLIVRIVFWCWLGGSYFWGIMVLSLLIANQDDCLRNLIVSVIIGVVGRRRGRDNDVRCCLKTSMMFCGGWCSCFDDERGGGIITLVVDCEARWCGWCICFEGGPMPCAVNYKQKWCSSVDDACTVSCLHLFGNMM